MSDRIVQALRLRLEEAAGMLPELVAALAVVFVFLLAGRAFSALFERTFARARSAEGHLSLIRRLIRWTFSGLGVVLALQLLGLTAVATSLLATGGLVAVVLGFAFREIGENLLAGLFLGLSRSFDVGDLIESSGFTGTVRQIDLRHVHIRSADGRDVYIPSAQIFRNVLVNFTRDRMRRLEFTVGIDYGDSPERARGVLAGVVSDTGGVLADPPPQVRLAAFTPQHQELGVNFWLRTGDAATPAEIRTRVMERCLEALRREGFRLSSEVSAAVELAPVRVRMEERPGRSRSPDASS